MGAPTSGFNARVRINGAVYNVAEWSVDARAPAQDATVTDGANANPLVNNAAVGFDANAPGTKGARVMLRSASFDPTQNFCLAPLALNEQTYAAVQIFPYSLAGTPWNFPSLYLESVKHAGNVKALEPVTIEGVSDGGYTPPTS